MATKKKIVTRKKTTTRKKTVRKNPTAMEMDYLIAKIVPDGRMKTYRAAKMKNIPPVLYWTGIKWTDTERKAMRFHDIESARELGSKIASTLAPAQQNVYVISEKEARERFPETKTNPKAKRNPVPLSKTAKIKRAIDLYESFTGHQPQYVDTMRYDVIDVGLRVGECTGILYETVRDGKKEQYIHKFRKSSRPLLVASFDGSQLYLLGGAYTFSDRGIIDK